jgi:hypothetical protein
MPNQFFNSVLIVYFILNAAQAIQHYVIKFVSDLWQFSPGSPVSSTNKTDRHNITEIFFKVVLNTINLIYRHDDELHS